MKKNFLLILFIAIFFQNQAIAQQPTLETTSESNPKKEKWQDRYNKASPEQKAKMKNKLEIMKKLTPEQRSLLKKEQQRHREEVIKITGSEIAD
jgi:hypothetical protein